jgi:hypothetical protein
MTERRKPKGSLQLFNANRERIIPAPVPWRLARRQRRTNRRPRSALTQSFEVRQQLYRLRRTMMQGWFHPVTVSVQETNPPNTLFAFRQ